MAVTIQQQSANNLESVIDGLEIVTYQPQGVVTVDLVSQSATL